MVWGRCFFYSKHGLIWASGFLCEESLESKSLSSLGFHTHPWTARGNAGRAMQRREELSERVSDPSLAFTFASCRSQTPVARAQRHTQCLVSRWQSRAVRAGALLFVSATWFAYVWTAGQRLKVSGAQAALGPWPWAGRRTEGRLAEYLRDPKPIFLFMEVWEVLSQTVQAKQGKLFEIGGSPVGCARITMGGRVGKRGGRAGGRSYLEIRRRLWTSRSLQLRPNPQETSPSWVSQKPVNKYEGRGDDSFPPLMHSPQGATGHLFHN